MGRVKHYVRCYEVQHRGSLHAHIILWLDPADVERVASEFLLAFQLHGMPQQTTLLHLLTLTCTSCFSMSPTSRCTYVVHNIVWPMVPHAASISLTQLNLVESLCLQLLRRGGATTGPSTATEMLSPIILLSCCYGVLTTNHKLCLVLLCAEVCNESRTSWPSHLRSTTVARL